MNCINKWRKPVIRTGKTSGKWVLVFAILSFDFDFVFQTAKLPDFFPFFSMRMCM